MADNNGDVLVNVKGVCLVCGEAVREQDHLVLLESKDIYVRFNADAKMTTPAVTYLWTHADHLN